MALCAPQTSTFLVSNSSLMNLFAKYDIQIQQRPFAIVPCNRCWGKCFVNTIESPNKRTCCPNFAHMLSFTRRVIQKIASDQFGSTYSKRFSLVSFASEAVRQQSLGPAENATRAVSNLVYSGGNTNHQRCVMKPITIQRYFTLTSF